MQSSQRAWFFELSEDNVGQMRRVIDAVPSGFVLSGILRAPPEMVRSGFASSVWGHLYPKYGSFEPVLCGTNGKPLPVGRGSEEQSRHPNLIQFDGTRCFIARVGEEWDEETTLGTMKNVAILYIQNGYRADLAFTLFADRNSDRVRARCGLTLFEWQGLDPCESGPQPPRVRVERDPRYARGASDCIDPILAACRRVGLFEYTPVSLRPARAA